jgi:vacuolar-type H+-ATPase subunit I/STV1
MNPRKVQKFQSCIDHATEVDGAAYAVPKDAEEDPPTVFQEAPFLSNRCRLCELFAA